MQMLFYTIDDDLSKIIEKVVEIEQFKNFSFKKYDSSYNRKGYDYKKKIIQIITKK